jgi:hypothetical protein
LGGLGYGVAFSGLATFEVGPGAGERDEAGCVDDAPAFLGAASVSLNAMAIPAALEPGLW